MLLRVATYNVHGGVGLDRRYDLDRIARVIAELDADVIGLQELQSRGSDNMLEILQRATNMGAIAAPTFRSTFGDFGNGVLTRLPIVARDCIDLSFGRREPRNAIDATLDCNGTPLRIICTHLGLRASERHEQLRRLIAAIGHHQKIPTVLLGDFNDWLPSQRVVRALDDHFGKPPTLGTFPSLCPVFALDRVWASAQSTLVNVHVHRSRSARVASDHLPLIAQLELVR